MEKNSLKIGNLQSIIIIIMIFKGPINQKKIEQLNH
jgi:hypothetical protein